MLFFASITVLLDTLSLPLDRFQINYLIYSSGNWIKISKYFPEINSRKLYRDSHALVTLKQPCKIPGLQT